MFCTTNAKYPLELAYKLAETKYNPDLLMAILENEKVISRLLSH